jgi:hypothetical protein
MTARGSSRGTWVVAGLLALGCLAPRTVAAQEWHELYAGGVAALRNGQAGKAADLLRRAIQKRPQAGRDVPTYGTNFEPHYFPYLRLAEAYLLLGAHEEARKVLETSARQGVEPAEERAALVARVSAALEARRPPPEPTAAPTQASTPRPAIVPPSPTPDTPAPPSVAAAPSPSTPVPPMTSPTAMAILKGGPGPSPRETSPRETPRREVLSTLDITSDPPGAQVFLDDEPVGRTDPETGRLRLTAVAAGRHRVRLSSEGHDDLIRALDLAGESLAFEGVLPHRQASSPPAPLPLAPILGLVVVLAILLGLWWRSVARQPEGLVDRVPTPSFPGNRSDPGTDESFPMPFGEYSLVRRIGKGGMAVVYEAERRGERFALKRPLAGFLDDTQFRERFLREAELGRTLHHPNIIRIFDRGQVGQIPYFAMELLQGETLRGCLDREGRLDPARAARVTGQVAEALDYAHNKGVIHRDLKPSNIMLDRSGGVKVMDYGIARAQRLEGLTTTGAFLGTPSYAAPETVEAGSQPPSDIYSLGVVFFEMLTGSLPFRGESAFAVLRSHCTTPPPVPSSLNYALPEVLDRIVLRLLSKEPAARPTAEGLLNELSDYLAGGR